MRDEYGRRKAAKLGLDLTRGRPSDAQLNLVSGFESCVVGGDLRAGDLDLRNYGGDIRGLPAARELFAEILGVAADKILVWNNSSLELMGYLLEWAVLFGVGANAVPWHTGRRKMIVLTPGYDRHIHLAEDLGFEMIAVAITADGSYWQRVEEIVSGDPAVKAIWVVPKYSNSSGHTLSAGEIRHMAAIKPAAGDFRFFVDNAYGVHDLYDEGDVLGDIYGAFAAAGREDSLYLFGSTAKITYAGAALGAFATGPGELQRLLKRFRLRSIGPHKINQAQHVKFIRGYPGGLKGLMRAHAALLRPRFAAVLDTFREQLGDGGLATWSNPRGGYFIDLNTQPGHAKRVIEVAADLGVKLTPAGSTFPGGIDPEDRNIRVAPSAPTEDEVRRAADVVAFAIKYVAAEKAGTL